MQTAEVVRNRLGKGEKVNEYDVLI